MRKTERFSAYQIEDVARLPFSADEYSRFKYGSRSLARKFGTILAESFFSQYRERLCEKPLVVIPSAFSHIQTAAGVMTSFFIDRLNLYFFEAGLPPVDQTKIHRTVTYREDYGEMSGEERFRLIGNDRFHIDKAFLGDKALVLIDDIKITGTHEKVILRMLDDYGIQNETYLLFLAELSNSAILPRVENYLNRFCVKELADLEQIIQEGDFTFNTRVVKFILNSPHEECVRFLSGQNFEFISDLFYLSIGNSYGQFDSYRRNLSYIQQLFNNIPRPV